MITVDEAKEFIRQDSDAEDTLIASLIVTAQCLAEGILRKKLSDFDVVPEPIKQAMLILVATLYEERQVSKSGKEGLDIIDTINLVRRMLFAYREDKF